MVGVRAELVFPEPDGCPMLDLLPGGATPATDISWSEPGAGTVTERFTTTTELDADAISAVFDYGETSLYEFERDRDEPCICEYIQNQTGPITGSYIRDGALYVTIHVCDTETLRELLRDFKAAFGRIEIKSLIRERSDTDHAEIVPTDLRQLTPRQREVLQTAYEMGYFDNPRRANIGDISDDLGITATTLREHLNAAHSKILKDLLVHETPQSRTAVIDR